MLKSVSEIVVANMTAISNLIFVTKIFEKSKLEAKKNPEISSESNFKKLLQAKEL